MIERGKDKRDGNRSGSCFAIALLALKKLERL